MTLVPISQSTTVAWDKEDLTPNDVFIHVHMKDHDGETFIDGRLAQLHAKIERKCEEHTQATSD
ncbi:hypothetical protein Syun_009473 [Stephania yunnanensis]|uniref:Uncharacterized protein n=1 Tax=Stephania yunnanensis TaxID=152371 RepID=A0AAP0PQP5_9MAGN